MQQSPSWEANCFSANQEIPLILFTTKFHYRIHKFPRTVPILNHIDPVHALTFHFLKIHLNIILPSTPGFPKWSLSLGFPYQNPVYVFPLPVMCYIPLLPYFTLFYQPKDIWFVVQIIHFKL